MIELGEEERLALAVAIGDYALRLRAEIKRLPDVGSGDAAQEERRQMLVREAAALVSASQKTIHRPAADPATGRSIA